MFCMELSMLKPRSVRVSIIEQEEYIYSTLVLFNNASNYFLGTAISAVLQNGNKTVLRGGFRERRPDVCLKMIEITWILVSIIQLFLFIIFLVPIDMAVMKRGPSEGKAEIII